MYFFREQYIYICSIILIFSNVTSFNGYLLLAFVVKNDTNKIIEEYAKFFGTLIMSYSLRLLSYIARFAI